MPWNACSRNCGMKVVEGYVLDTTICSASWDYGSPRHGYVRQRLGTLKESPVYVTAVSIGEVEYGLQVAPAIDARRQCIVRRAMSSYQVLHIDHHTARVYAEVKANLFRKYSPRTSRGRLSHKRVEDLVERTTGKTLGIQENDLWIVSVAVQHNMIVVTSDRMCRVIEAAQYCDRTEYWN